MILVYYHRHDIRTARRAALQESQRDTAAAEYRTQQHQQHVLTVDRAGQHEHHILGDHVLDDIHRQRQHHDTVYGLYAEVPAYDEAAEDQQYTVDYEYQLADRQERDQVAQQHGQTGRAAAHTAGRHHASYPAERIHEHTKRHEDILLYARQHRHRCNFDSHNKIQFAAKIENSRQFLS